MPPTPRTAWRIRASLLAWSAAVALGVSAMTGPPAAAADRDTPAGSDSEHEEQVQDEVYRELQQLLRDKVRQRQRVLAELDRKATRWARVKAARAAARRLKAQAAGRKIRLVMPLESYRLSARFGAEGPLWSADHTGQDFSAPWGAPIFAMRGARITEVGYAGAYGLRTVLELKDGTELWYCHQSLALVEEGDQVKRGESVGLVGSSGNSTGPHLHLEVRPGGGDPVDPVAWMQALGLDLGVDTDPLDLDDLETLGTPGPEDPDRADTDQNTPDRADETPDTRGTDVPEGPDGSDGPRAKDRPHRARGGPQPRQEDGPLPSRVS